ncbi:MAG: Multidrug resistance protein MdtA [bacterium]|nr:Multidrug resistance protein MdtA [bacterium]
MNPQPFFPKCWSKASFPDSLGGNSLRRLAILALAAMMMGCSEKAPPPPTEPTPKVRVLKVEPTVVEPTLEVTGTVISQEIARVHPEVSGSLLRVHVREGDKVQAGDTLAEIDPRTFQLNLDVATAERLKAQTEYNRISRGYRPEDIEAQRGKFRNALAWYELELSNLDRNRKLNESGVMTPKEWSDFLQKLTAQKALVESASSELVKMEAGYESYDIAGASAALRLATAREELAQRDLERTRLKSPISGVITKRLVEVGQLVSPSLELFEVQDPKRLWLLAEVGEKHAAQVAPGQKATLRPDNGFGEAPGWVDRVGGALSPQTHSLQVWLSWESDNALPPIGVFARGVIDLPDIPDTYKLRREWVHMSEGVHFVWEVREKTLHQRPVTLGEDRGDQVCVAEGLEPGVLVVVTPPSNFREGIAVLSEPYLPPANGHPSDSQLLSQSRLRTE